jgi:hypothetical protein
MADVLSYRYLSLWVFAPFAPRGPLIWVHVAMLQATPYVLHFKRVLDFGEGQDKNPFNADTAIWRTTGLLESVVHSPSL